ncbi:MAG: hypothetical protein Q9194_007284 [Teloschistes cf. exilis]
MALPEAVTVAGISQLWIFDSGAAQYITHDKSVFLPGRFTMFDTPHSVKGIGGSMMAKDLMGPINSKYFITYLDDWCKLSEVHVLNNKRAETVVASARHLRNAWATESFDLDRLCFVRLHSDNGDEYLNDTMAEFCNEHGITQETTTPGNP